MCTSEQLECKCRVVLFFVLYDSCEIMHCLNVVLQYCIITVPRSKTTNVISAFSLNVEGHFVRHKKGRFCLSILQGSSGPSIATAFATLSCTLLAGFVVFAH